MKQVVLIDNYDSFTYNLVQYVEELIGRQIAVIRNDKTTLTALENFDVILLSPGPGVPSEAGLLIKIIQHFTGKKPMFGVCLGLQAMAEAFGGELINLKRVYHGLATEVTVTKEDLLFNGLQSPFLAGRYHSWVADKSSLPSCFEVIAVDSKENEIMAIRHKEQLVKAVQFHPESILTPDGKTIIANFLTEAGVI